MVFGNQCLPSRQEGDGNSLRLPEVIYLRTPSRCTRQNKEGGVRPKAAGEGKAYLMDGEGAINVGAMPETKRRVKTDLYERALESKDVCSLRTYKNK